MLPDLWEVYGRKVPDGMKEPDMVLSESAKEKEKERLENVECKVNRACAPESCCYLA